MFELRPVAGWSGSGESAETNLLERVAVDRAALPLTPLTPVALQRGQPRLLVEAGRLTSYPNLANRRPTSSRFLDVTFAMAALVFFAPLMGLVALAIVATGPGPIFFRQQRLGLGGRTFGCLKFRTMRRDADRILPNLLSRDPFAKAEWDSTYKLRRDPRVSRLGKFLRKTSLDELPQFFNVLMGEMSIVGPRPIVAEEAYRYRHHISSYYAVKPGITGLWQISGRNHTTYRRRVACDVQYVRTRNAYRDLAIIALTVPIAMLGRGAY